MTKKKPPFPLGCAIICYETMPTRRVGRLVGWSEVSVQTYLRRAGVKLRPRGGDHAR